MTAALQLFVDRSFFSPYAMFAYVALKEKGLRFQLHPIDLRAGRQHDEDYRARSLTGRVPALVHGDFALSESSAIIEYLDEAFPAPDYPALLPADRTDRARARQLQAWLRSDLLALREERPTAVIFEAPRHQPLSAAAREAVDKLMGAAQRLLPASGGELFGRWCIADIELALMLNRLAANGDPLPPALLAYVARQWQRASVQAWVHHEPG